MLCKLTLTVGLALLLAAPGHTASAYKPTTKFQPGCLEVRQGINFYRGKVWHWQDKLGWARAKSNFITKEQPASCKYAYWVSQLWALRASYFHNRYNSLWNAKTPDQIKFVIRWVFKGYGDQAVEVASCETGGTFSLWAENGQYKNIFQMGESERTQFGWHTIGSPAIVAAKAAKAYFDYSLRVNGYGWYPWECRP